MTNYNKIKLAQAICMISVLLTLTLSFSWTLLLSGLAVSWLFWCFGLNITLHKLSSHRTFEPRNRLIKYFLLWTGTVIAMGSSINFAAGHRQHHVHADTPQDPYCLDGTVWHRIKLFFYWFPAYKINPMTIKDLLRDPDHSLFNAHYWKILAVYPLVLLLIDPVLFGYFYALPVTYIILGMGYVTVLAHSKRLQKFGTRPYNTNDNSWNSQLFVWLLAGEGYHNTHHAQPGRYDYGVGDISGKIIKWLK